MTNQHGEFVLWFFTGSKCNLECTHCYVESSPTADRHPLLTYNTFKRYLNEAISRDYNKLEIYFTGGEPFVNPDLLKMFKETMKYADTTVLTNATRITEDIAVRLQNIQNESDNKLIFRVSLDGPDAQSNNKIRGNKAFERATKGLEKLVNHGFNPIVTSMRSWSLLKQEEVKKQYVELLVEQGIPREDQLLKILPPLRIGREEQRDRPYTKDELFTEDCFKDYDYNNLQCSKCRMVSENGVWVCPILINEEGAKMGNTIAEASKEFDMTYMACWTCRMEGMSCTNDV